MSFDPGSDGPPPYRVAGFSRVRAWRESMPKEWVDLEVGLWLSGLHWDPWQEPSFRSGRPGPRHDEVRRAVVPGTWIAVSYVVDPQKKYVRILEVAEVR